jgi:hypothetical protein
MAIRNVQDPHGGRTGLVDTLIGNAFDIVYLVARHINEIKYIVANMEAVILVAKNLPESVNITRKLTLGNRGQITTYDLPDEVTVSNLASSSLMVIDNNGDAFPNQDGNFQWWYDGGKLKIYLSPDAPLVMAQAEARWNITYKVL